ncbi:MAG: hypothetical protein P8105_10080 [Dehalococcoidia bacterium]
MAEGAELSQLKPRHINPSEKALSLLMTKNKKEQALKETRVFNL